MISSSNTWHYPVNWPNTTYMTLTHFDQPIYDTTLLWSIEWSFLSVPFLIIKYPLLFITFLVNTSSVLILTYLCFPSLFEFFCTRFLSRTWHIAPVNVHPEWITFSSDYAILPHILCSINPKIALIQLGHGNWSVLHATMDFHLFFCDHTRWPYPRFFCPPSMQPR